MITYSRPKVRYAVVGLGHIAQTAVLPAFANAEENSVLAALVSEDPVKQRLVGETYSIKQLYSYEEYEQLLHSGLIDAVYIALPNHMHCEYTVRAAQAGVHVLCEKPMAVTEDECQRMIAACEANDVRLMIAYRLHFDPSNLRAIEQVQAGKIGEPRYFLSAFSLQAKEGGIRLRSATGGGSVYDIGIYCINAARYLFQDEPLRIRAISVSSKDPRFREVDEMTSAILEFPGERLAAFTCSLGAADVSMYRIVGTKGKLLAEPAYDYAEDLIHHWSIGDETYQEHFPAHDQFGPELVYFSQCVQMGEQPEPSGYEGLADVRIIEAIYRSAAEGKAVLIEPLQKVKRPSMAQVIPLPTVDTPPMIHTESPRQ